jgi:L-galactose dehydrogenase
MQKRPLGRTGLQVTPLGVSVGLRASAADAHQELLAAIDCGVTLIHASSGAEAVVGDALKGCPRSGVVHCLTLRYTGGNDYAAKRLAGTVDASLLRMGVDQIDVVLLETDGLPDDQIEHETLPALGRIRATGKIRFMGIASSIIDVVGRWTRHPALDVLCVPGRATLQDSSLYPAAAAAHRADVAVIAVDPLAMGLLSDQGGQGNHPAPQEVKALCARAAEHCRRRGSSLEKLAIQYALLQSDISSNLLLSPSTRQISAAIEWAQMPIDRDLLRDVMRIIEPVHNVSCR